MLPVMPHFLLQLRSSCPQYLPSGGTAPVKSRNRFLDKLAQKGLLWSQVLAAFRDALARLDFKPAWRSEELGEFV